MPQCDDPEIALEDIRTHLLGDGLLSVEQTRLLLALSSHPTGSLRERALGLLLHPPVTDLLANYRHLLRFLATGGRNLRDLPPALWELLWEVVVVLGGNPREPAVARSVGRVLRHFPPRLMRALLGQSLPVKPFLANIRLSSFGIPSRYQTPAVKRRWRHLRHRLLAEPAAPSWSELTLADLGHLVRRKRSGCHLRFPAGAWRGQGRLLILAPADPASRPPALPLPRCSWGWVDGGGRRYLNRLLSAHCEELREVRALAETVSYRTRRVVLSWHNASLAASSGWAFAGLGAQFPSTTLWHSFEEAVQNRLRRLQAVSPDGRRASQALGAQQRQRLVVPKIYHALWEKRLLAGLDPAREPEWRKALELAGRVQGFSEQGFAEVCKGFGWISPVSPHQRLDLPALLDWATRYDEDLHNGLVRLAVLIQEGQWLLDEGRLPHLVLPWIDKFFISSRREADREYLVALIGWLAGAGPRPLILLWEDTPHPLEPTLKLVLKRLHDQGQPVRGIGVFDWQGSSRAQALDIICREHQAIILFALRPYRDCHNPHSFQQLLQERPYRFFRNYDSSWKDGVYFLYAGTQVFPLLAVPSDRENVPPWIAGAGGKYPFGAYWRGRLQAVVAGELAAGRDTLSLPYARWANLC